MDKLWVDCHLIFLSLFVLLFDVAYQIFVRIFNDVCQQLNNHTVWLEIDGHFFVKEPIFPQNNALI